MKKYADVPQKDVQVVSPKGHRQIEENLHKMGKTSASSVTPNKRKAAFEVQ